MTTEDEREAPAAIMRLLEQSRRDRVAGQTKHAAENSDMVNAVRAAPVENVQAPSRRCSTRQMKAANRVLVS